MVMAEEGTPPAIKTWRFLTASPNPVTKTLGATPFL